MNILVPYSWLKEFIKTKASPLEIAEYLSLCSQSVEKITKTENDFVFEIEITSNRADCLSVYGIARELSAILPRFGIPAKLEKLTSYELKNKNYQGKLKLEVEIKNKKLCPRFTALIFDNVKIAPSPKIVQERLEKSGIRSLNNVVDISNYLMLELGQPMHTFDYDKIIGAKMILREAKEGEKIVTLDGQLRILPQGTIVIEDGKGRIIDLCGIMGGENSAVDNNSKRILLFVQTYDPTRIRQTCQKLSFRTEAASRFEKGVDPEGVIIAINKAKEMFEENCGAQVASKLIDIYPNPLKEKIVELNLDLVEKIIGVKIPRNEILEILKSLGFVINFSSNSQIKVSIPHWRNDDISIPEDLIEEIARIYGYQNLPNNIPLSLPKSEEKNPFFWEEKIKNFLKYQGFTEVINYSMISEDLLRKTKFDPKDYLKISNPLSSDWVYMRPSLIPSILKNISQNQNNFSDISLFEISKIYIPQGENELPEEIPMLVGAQTGDEFLKVKGILEMMFEELGIKNYRFNQPVPKTKIFNPQKTAEILINEKPVGFLGEIDNQITSLFEISSRIILFEIDFNSLLENATLSKKYTPLPLYPPIIEDLSFVVPPKIPIGKIIQSIKSTSSIIKSVDLLDIYKNTKTFRIIYQHPLKTLNNKEITKIREKIIEKVEKEFKVKIKNSF